MAKKFEEVNEAVENEELNDELQEFDDDVYEEDALDEESKLQRFGRGIVNGAKAVGRGIKKAVPAIVVGTAVVLVGAAAYAWTKAKDSVDGGCENSEESESSDGTQSENESAE